MLIIKDERVQISMCVEKTLYGSLTVLKIWYKQKMNRSSL